jgi:hypothetical protein
MRFRKLRIAWSVVWGIICLLLFLFWERSLWSVDQIVGQISSHGFIGIIIEPGACGIEISSETNVTPWTVISMPADRYFQILKDFDDRHSRIWGYFHFKHETFVLPFWFLILASMIVGTVPWLRWRYSLRTLLIATTLLAMLLGLAVWATRA